MRSGTSARRHLVMAVAVVLAAFSAGALVALAMPAPRLAVAIAAGAGLRKSAASKVGAADVTPALRVPLAAAVTVFQPKAATSAGPARQAGPAASQVRLSPSPRAIVSS